MRGGVDLTSVATTPLAPGRITGGRFGTVFDRRLTTPEDAAATWDELEE
jgi:hypothetical protein